MEFRSNGPTAEMNANEDLPEQEREGGATMIILPSSQMAHQLRREEVFSSRRLDALQPKLAPSSNEPVWLRCIPANSNNYYPAQATGRSPIVKKESVANELLSMPVVATLLNHPFHLSYPPACVVKFSVQALQREIQRLTANLSERDRYISELEQAKQARGGGMPASGNNLGTNSGEMKAAVIVQSPEMEELRSSVASLKEEFKCLQYSAVDAIRLASDELLSNYKKIMDYVHEEVEVIRREIGINHQPKSH